MGRGGELLRRCSCDSKEWEALALTAPTLVNLVLCIGHPVLPQAQEYPRCSCTLNPAMPRFSALLCTCLGTLPVSQQIDTDDLGIWNCQLNCQVSCGNDPLKNQANFSGTGNLSLGGRFGYFSFLSVGGWGEREEASEQVAGGGWAS